MPDVEFVAEGVTRALFPDGVQPGLKVQAAGKGRGLSVRANPHWAALGPPLITPEADVDEMLAILDASIEEVEAELLPQ